MTNSIRKMLESKEAKRADAVHVQYESLHIEPGFNLREAGPDLEESIEALTQHIMDGGKFPPLEVRLRDDGGAYVVDGHRRHAAFGRALERGAPLRNPADGKAWVHVVVFEGNDADRTARIITSATNKPLTPLEMAEGYKRLRAFGWAPTHIAKKVGKSTEHVQQLLALGDAPNAVREMVTSGDVSASRAAKTARSLGGDKAAETLAVQVAEAKAQGASRVTPKTIGGGKSSASELQQERTRLDWVIAEQAIVLKDIEQGDFYVSLPGRSDHQISRGQSTRVAIDNAIAAIKQQITT